MNRYVMEKITIPTYLLQQVLVGYASDHCAIDKLGDGEEESCFIRVEWRENNAWAVISVLGRMNTDLCFEHEPSPSNRTQEYIDKHTWSSFSAAWLAAKKYIEKYDGVLLFDLGETNDVEEEVSSDLTQ